MVIDMQEQSLDTRMHSEPAGLTRSRATAFQGLYPRRRSLTPHLYRGAAGLGELSRQLVVAQ